MPLLVLTPMFLFCGVFFPLESLPAWARTLARFLPLTYAVQAARALMEGHPTRGDLLPLLGLVPPIIVGLFLAASLIRRRLIR